MAHVEALSTLKLRGAGGLARIHTLFMNRLLYSQHRNPINNKNKEKHKRGEEEKGKLPTIQSRKQQERVFVMCSSIYRFMSWAHCQKSPTLIRKCLAWQPHAAQHVFLNIWIMSWQIVHAGPNEPRLTGPMSLHQQLFWFEWTHGITN